MSKKVLIVVGTRPNFIKVTQFERVFDSHGDAFEYRLLHTGQHYDDNMSKIFFEQFKLKKPDYYLNIQGLSPASQIANIILQLETILEDWRPDIMLVPGDVNSTMAASVAANKCGIRVGHIESGLRSFDREMPEEINRLVADQIADQYFITEQSGLDNLSKEGHASERMHFVGNTMIDTLVAFDEQIQQSDITEKLGIVGEDFALMTMHRPRNVDTAPRLKTLLGIVDHLTKKLKLVWPIHPRTAASLKKHGLYDELTNNPQVVVTEALDYLAFQKLISDCKFVITDSGGIQEETTFRQVPCLTLRENTERPSTLELGSNELVEYDAAIVGKKIDQILDGSFKKGQIPPLWDGKATERIVEAMKQFL